MMPLFRRFISTVLVVLIIAAMAVGAQAQNQSQQFIGNPGQWVSGPFLQYYLSSANPELLFGNPISIEFNDATTNQRVQYFEKARFDLIEGNEGTGGVVAAPLGEYLYEPDNYKEAGIPYDPAVCKRFENAFSVCYAFWQFYQSNDGMLHLGLPLADAEINTAGFLVQYFQNGILEWHPEKEAGQRVVPGDLGRRYFDQFVNDPAYMHPDLNTLPAGILRVPQVSVFVANAIVTANSNQTVHVVVKDQFQQPVSGAVIGVTATMPDGRDFFFRLPESNSSGLSTFELLIGDYSARDVVLISALVTTPGGSATGESWFRIWW